MSTFGLVGYPLGHSWSAKYFTEKFAQWALPHRYLNVSHSRLIDALNELKSSDFSGFNVTIPFKKTIVPHLHSLTPDAMAVGAVNCVKVVNRQWIGHNTDSQAWRETFQAWNIPRPDKALVLGTGGGAAAVVHALRQLGISFTVVGRTAAVNYSNLSTRSFETHRLIVNTTPLGMWPNTLAKPELPYHLVGTEHSAYDLVYNPPRTAFLQACEERGAQVMNGAAMLQRQAELSWDFWQNG